ncbi:MAG: NAD(P)H-dependent oxidoreductase subunit E [Candidatus Aminicenantes bacterium]|nr:MAG: NAD(P)H-dependent oxidoreductase subunit E [Candidatus Aminicenantes bacterium]
MEKSVDELEKDQRELIHVLHDVQEEFGYIPAQAISQISKQLKISESEIFGVLTFYKAFSLKPRGEHLITICVGTACHVRGAPMILDEFERKLGIKAGETSEDNQFTLETVNCVGACALGPIAIADGEYHGQLKTRKVDKIIDKLMSTKRNGSD